MAATPDLAAIRDRLADAAARGVPVRIRGGGSKDFLGARLEGEPLDTRDYAGVVDYEPSELVVTARAGTPLATLEALLAASGQCLPCEPPHFGGAPTVGGAVAAGLAGPARAALGGMRDYVLGAKLLTARGELLAFGGRVMKNVAGFDVARLLCGSFGILGLIAEVSLKVLPRPAAAATLAFELGEAAALESFLGWARRPLPVTASAWVDGRAYLRLAGAPAAVAAAGRTLGGSRLGDAEAAVLWAALRDHAHPWLAPRTPLWRLSVPAASAALGLPGTTLIEWGGALRWVRSDAPAATIREAARRAGGSAARWHGAGLAPAHEPLPAPLAAIHRRLKDAFDPDRRFNPGRLVAEL
ncbi:MAG: glycolate oxidase subunit GlcE [Proteobacteria bacterium]|nr:glycolate oxidase subunit GlcE [Pseudomonadota bacterium]